MWGLFNAKIFSVEKFETRKQFAWKWNNLKVDLHSGKTVLYF